jgi:transposase
MPVPALPPYVIEPIWQQFAALLPEREMNPPLGCHRSRISDRMVFEKLVQVLVFGCAYERIADQSCSATTTLRDRRDEWIELGAMDTLRALALEAYDRFVGLELPAVWRWSVAAQRPLAAARKPAEARWTGGSRVPNAPRRWTQKASP